jgi:hypothetical protein
LLSSPNYEELFEKMSAERLGSIQTKRDVVRRELFEISQFLLTLSTETFSIEGYSLVVSKMAEHADQMLLPIENFKPFLMEIAVLKPSRIKYYLGTDILLVGH